MVSCLSHAVLILQLYRIASAKSAFRAARPAKMPGSTAKVAPAEEAELTMTRTSLFQTNMDDDDVSIHWFLPGLYIPVNGQIYTCMYTFIVGLSNYLLGKYIDPN